MTTYPLSEPATAYAAGGGAKASPRIVCHGTLVDCAASVAALPRDEQRSASIKMDALDLSYDPTEVDELIRYLRDEEPGLSDQDIAEVAGRID